MEKLATVLVTFFLGGLGVHRFTAGRMAREFYSYLRAVVSGLDGL